MRFGNHAQFLCTVSQSFSEQSSASDRIKSLHDLKTSRIGRSFRVQPRDHSLETEIITVRHSYRKNCDPDCRYRNPDPDYYKKRLRLRMAYKNQNTCNPRHDDRRTQVICQKQNACRCHCAKCKYLCNSFRRICPFPKTA